MTNWMKVKEAAKYSGVSKVTFRRWLKDGLRHSRLTERNYFGEHCFNR